MKQRFFLPVVGYFIGWFYWKTLLEPWPMLLFCVVFLGWGVAIGLKKQPKGKMHWFWVGVTVLIALFLGPISRGLRLSPFFIFLILFGIRICFF